MDDAAIRAALANSVLGDIPINKATRDVLLMKIAQLSERSSTEGTPASNSVSPTLAPEDPGPQPRDDAASISKTSKDSFYALAIDTTCSDFTDCEHIQHIYTCREDALRAIQLASGARFLKFNTESAACSFKEQQLLELKRGNVDKRNTDSVNVATNKYDSPIVVEKANRYPSLETQDLSEFRRLIEQHDVEGFITAVKKNPRHLITSGDAPEILKPPLRYNALHCAVKSGCLEICQSLFGFLEGDEFWSLVYRDDSDEIRRKRRYHLIDLYLNTCDKGLQETPLHFACKLGYKDIVSYLLTFPALDTQATNIYGETAYEVTCTNDKNQASDAKKIRSLLIAPEVYYVPVLRAVDNSIFPKLSAPCTLQELEIQQNTPLDKNAAPVISSAIAGPMSPLQAKAFYREWRTPSDSVERKELVYVKRSDPDRGLERVGRRLAHKQKIQWKEHWTFLDSLCDLSMLEGLGTLESYLRNSSLEENLSISGEVEMLSENPLFSPGSPLLQSNDKSCEVLIGGGGGGGTRDPKGNMNLSNGVRILNEDNILAELMHSKLNLATPKSTDIRKGRFLTGLEPTKLDYDVMLALGDSHLDLQMYPSIAHWLEHVESYSEEEQKRWRTPSSSTKHRQFRTDYHTPQMTITHSQSPLVYSSPQHTTVTPMKLLYDEAVLPPDHHHYHHHHHHHTSTIQ